MTDAAELKKLMEQIAAAETRLGGVQLQVIHLAQLEKSLKQIEERVAALQALEDTFAQREERLRRLETLLAGGPSRNCPG